MLLKSCSFDVFIYLLEIGYFCVAVYGQVDDCIYLVVTKYFLGITLYIERDEEMKIG